MSRHSKVCIDTLTDTQTHTRTQTQTHTQYENITFPHMPALNIYLSEK